VQPPQKLGILELPIEIASLRASRWESWWQSTKEVWTGLKWEEWHSNCLYITNCYSYCHSVMS
jgi:hypothetical protein